MIEAYKQGKDFYATLATGVYNNTYWENMEHWEDGSPNPEGKKRRGICKQLLLGILYGMGSDSLAEKIGKTKEEAEDIIQKFYKGFPVAKAWIDKTESDAVKNGYVEDLWGRRRRLPDIQLPMFSVEYKNSTNYSIEFNPLIGSKNIYKNPKSSLIEKYTKMMQNARFKKEKEDITSQALKDGIIIHSNSSKISQAKRQCVNARVQGSASTMSKKAMINVHNDPELNRLGFKILIAVHDELIGECPEENAEAVADRLTEVMRHAADPDAKTPFKCDPTIEKCWYYSDYSDVLRNEYNKLTKDKSEEEQRLILDAFYIDHSECTREQLNEIVGV